MGTRTPVVCSQDISLVSQGRPHNPTYCDKGLPGRELLEGEACVACAPLWSQGPPECLVQNAGQVVIHGQDNLQLEYLAHTNNNRTCWSEAIPLSKEFWKKNIYESLKPHMHSKYFKGTKLIFGEKKKKKRTDLPGHLGGSVG